MTSFRFRPFLALFSAAAVCAAGGLALWQFDRAAQKRGLEAAARAGLAAAPILLSAESPAPQRFQRARLAGRFPSGMEFFIDNRIRGRRPGYDVAAPFLPDGGGVVIVNRGWIPARLDRRVPAAPPPAAAHETRTTLRGVFIADQSGAFELGESTASPDPGKVLQNLKTRELAESLGLALRTTLVLALEAIGEAELEAGMLPPTVVVNFRSARSTAYAWQWLTFGLLAIVFFFALSREPRRGGGGDRKTQEGRIRNRPVFWILLIGIGAPVLSTALFFFWRPDSFTHYGELISPPVAIPSEWRRTEGGGGGDGGDGGREWEGKWILLRAGGSECDGGCRRQLCRMRQLRLMMHGDYHRIARGWLLTDSGVPSAAIAMTTDCGEPRAAALRQRATEVNVVSEVAFLRGVGVSEIMRVGWLHIADPRGFVVMRYPPGSDLYEIRKDFRRLLKLSQRRGTR